MAVRPHQRTLRFAAVALAAVLAIVAAGCGSGDSTSSTTSPQTAATSSTTAAPATTTTTTTTAAPSTTTTPDTNSLAEGSGCTPGTSGSLPDGEWFVYVSAATPAELEVDLACWFTGDAATKAAAEDGEESPPPNDYYVRNANPALRTNNVGSDVIVSWLPNPGDPSTETTIPYANWLTDRETRGFQPGVWLTISSGDITEIREQYVP